MLDSSTKEAVEDVSTITSGDGSFSSRNLFAWWLISFSVLPVTLKKLIEWLRLASHLALCKLYSGYGLTSY